MKKSSSIFLVVAFSATAFLLSTNPVLAEDHVGNGALQAIRAQFSELQKEFQALRQAAPGDRSAFERFLSKLSSITNSLSELKKSVREERTLSRGSSGEDVKKLQEQLKEFKDIYPEGLVTGHFGQLTENAVKKVQEKYGLKATGIVDVPTREKIAELSSPAKVSVPSPGHPAELPKPLKDIEVAKSAKKGDSGEHVKKTQEFLNMFPEIYPNGLATGYYGEQTEQAVKKFQEKVGLKQSGEVDEKTKEILNLLLVAGEKKKPPKITDVTPSSGSAGIIVTLSGKGFTDEKNSIMVRGKIVATGLQSYDNNTQLDFLLTPDVPCTTGSKKACPIKVVNANGISNAKPFKLTEFLLIPPGVATTTPPPPVPALEPPPPPPPPTPVDTVVPLRSNGLPSGELSYGTKSTTLSLTTDENATCKYSTAAGVAYASMTSQFSTTGGTSHSAGLSGLEDGKSYNYYVRCQDNLGNINLDDFGIAFTVASPPKPVIMSLFPAKGPLGTIVTINGSGFTSIGNSVNFAGVVAASNLSSADGKTVIFSVPLATTCQIGESCTVSVSNANGISNEVSFLRTQVISPVKVIFPNGNENLVQGVDFILSWTGGTDRVDIVLVEEGAVNGLDPSEFIVGWIATSTKPNSTVTWNAKQVCSADGLTCTQVTPGRYKLMALSEDETGNLVIWDDLTDLPGNWDLSNSAFTISPSATLTVVVPNGGEIGSHNSPFIICWATIDLKSKNVKIELLKNGALFKTVYYSYSQPSETGAFITNWVIPGDIPEGADYQVKISDVALPTQNDLSDGPFSIKAAASAIQVYQPNSGTIWYSGFDGPVYWYSSNIPSKAVNINLWKGGFFYRNLASNLPQTYYYGDAFSTGWFWRKINIPADLPTAKDYVVEVVDALDPSIRGLTLPFTVVQYPSYMTVKGRLFDYLTKAPLGNVQVSTWDGTYDWYNNRTNLNGEFSIVATTSDVLLSRGHSFWAYPSNHEYKYFSIRSSSLGLYAYINIFPFIGPSRSFPVSSGSVDLGEIPFWPFVDNTNTVSDTQIRTYLNYRDSSTGQSTRSLSGGYTYFNYSNSYWKWLPQALDVWARIEDKPGNVYYSPILNLPATPAVPSQTLSLFNNTIKWEPYALNSNAWYWPQTLKIGTPLSGYAYVYGGVAPYTWSILAGSLPPGVTLSSSGSISGAPTASGVYDVFFRVQDANKVNGATPNKLRFDVRNETGVEVPTIQVRYPQARQEMYPGGSYSISWESTGILSKSVGLELLKGGSVVTKIGGYAQSLESGSYYYTWKVPEGLLGGTDYSIRVSDVLNSATYGESDQFIIVSRTGSASWNYSWGAKYSPYISVGYATSTNPDYKTFKLYQKKPGETDLTVVATFSDPKCNQGLIFGKWYLSVFCYYWYSVPSWSIRYNTYVPASEFPQGEYSYEMRAVDSLGQEKSVASVKLRSFEAVKLLSPLSADSPLGTKTPTFRWTIPQDWPSTLEKPYSLVVEGMRTYTYTYSSGYTYTYTYPYTHYSSYGLSAPGDTEGFRVYSGPALDPTQKYNVTVSYNRTVIDPATSLYVNHTAMSATSTTFWISP